MFAQLLFLVCILDACKSVVENPTSMEVFSPGVHAQQLNELPVVGTINMEMLLTVTLDLD